MVNTMQTEDALGLFFLVITLIILVFVIINDRHDRVNKVGKYAEDDTNEMYSEDENAEIHKFLGGRGNSNNRR